MKQALDAVQNAIAKYDDRHAQLLDQRTIVVEHDGADKLYIVKSGRYWYAVTPQGDRVSSLQEAPENALRVGWMELYPTKPPYEGFSPEALLLAERMRGEIK